MLDIIDGDLLVIGGDTYLIRGVGAWSGALGDSAGFKRMATVTASTKRAPAVASNQRGVPTTNLATVKVTPFDILDDSIGASIATESPTRVLRCYAADATGYAALTCEKRK